jgi:hypothetical protein
MRWVTDAAAESDAAAEFFKGGKSGRLLAESKPPIVLPHGGA